MSYFYPEQVASSYLVDNRFEAFADKDIEMIAYTPSPCRGVSEVKRLQYKNIKCEKLYHNKLCVYRFPMYKEPKGSIGRLIRYTLCCIKYLYHGLKSKDVDLVFLSSTPPIMGIVGALIKKWRKIPFVYNLQDIFPDSLISTGLAKKGGLLWNIGRKIENFIYHNADKIIVISQDFKNNLINKGISLDKIEVIYNWVDEQAVININRSDNRLIKKYNLDPEKFYITYSGNIGLTQNMDLLIRVAEELKEYKKIHFVLIGDGAYKHEVEKIIKERAIENITLLPFQPYEDISHVFSLGNVGLVISKPGVGANSVPSKTWSILSAGRPVLANFDPNELKDIINDNHCGIFTAAGDFKLLKESIIFMSDHPDLCEKYGENGRKYIEQNLTKKIGTSKLVNVVKIFEK